MTYKDRAYCASRTCSNIDCDRHLETTDGYYSLKNNKEKLPVSMSDFTKHCKEHTQKKITYFYKGADVSETLLTWEESKNISNKNPPHQPENWDTWRVST